MDRRTKKIVIISSYILIFFGIVITPRIAAADEVTVSGSSANSATVIKGNNNTSANTSNNFETNYIIGQKITNYIDNTDSFISGNITGEASFQSIQGYSVNCSCPKKHSKPTSPSPAQPTDNSVPASSSSTTSSTSTGFSFLSSGPGTILVASENSFFVSGSYWFFIALIGNILMMLLGAYLRLRSGRSPGFAFTF